VNELLVTRAGYQQDDMISTGLIAVNMSKEAPHGFFLEGRLFECHKRKYWKVDFDIIYLGGESIGCPFSCGVTMLPSNRRKDAAASSWASRCAYLFPKKLLLPSNSTRKDGYSRRGPVSIANSVGYSLDRRSTCVDALITADYVAFRNLPSTNNTVLPNAVRMPDCAVMVDRPFHTIISQHAETGPVQEIIRQTRAMDGRPSGYLAVQISATSINSMGGVQHLAAVLDEVFHHTNLTTVFFMAGSVQYHDSLQVYQQIAEAMKTPSLMMEHEHVWSIVALVSRAAAIVGTSLHVRIMSFIHARPRVTICTDVKHRDFVNMWEATDALPCVEPLTVKGTGLLAPVKQVLQTSPQLTQEAVDRAISMYLQGFETWSSLLTAP
jgi:hypothetical protein